MRLNYSYPLLAITSYIGACSMYPTTYFIPITYSKRWTTKNTINLHSKWNFTYYVVEIEMKMCSGCSALELSCVRCIVSKALIIIYKSTLVELPLEKIPLENVCWDKAPTLHDHHRYEQQWYANPYIYVQNIKLWSSK